VLLYESSKCFHGRPHKFNGSWYSSIFVHFNPASKEWAVRTSEEACHITKCCIELILFCAVIFSKRTRIM
jgi:hypothetical protein